MSGTGTSTTPADASSTCSNSTTADGTTQQCPAHTKSVTKLRWSTEETWCSEPATLTGETRNYTDGEQLAIDVKDKADGASVKNFNASISGDAFSYNWDVIDVLPSGGPSFLQRRRFNGEGGGKTTPKSLVVNFVPNLRRHTWRKNISLAVSSIGVDFDLKVENYLLFILADVKYVKGRGRWVLDIATPTATGGFSLWGSTQHWGRKLASGTFQYWDGSSWQNTPSGWTPTDTNHSGISFYEHTGFFGGKSWRCEIGGDYPDPITGWSTDPTITTPATNRISAWKTEIESVWGDSFDIRRKKSQCRSTKEECCRYKTKCEMNFTEVTEKNDHVIVVTYDDVRSHSLMWSTADGRSGLASHEFGHHLGVPDEYPGQGTTQTTTSDSDGLLNGVDDNCLMGINLTPIKKRHFAQICNHLAEMVKDQYGKDYEYEAIEKGTTIASPAGTAVNAEGMPPKSNTGAIVGAIIGAVVGAVAGAILGFVASGGNPAAAAAGAVAGGIMGAAIGAGIGSLF
jgi:hypothetical protein